MNEKDVIFILKVLSERPKNPVGITLGSLFDGIGGFPYAAIFYGIEPLWASEIDPRCVSVTRRHFPKMAHVGDITKLDGAALPPVDIITFGSPCQDLSMAGRRAGLQGERSSLFMDAIRIIYEMREATNGRYPRWAVWENVPGALSSSAGRDFQSVLAAFTKTEIPLPRNGKWANAGMVRGGSPDLAWCVYNAQHFGVPQRRRRIFLVADFTGGRAGEILFVPKSLYGYLATCGTAGKNLAAYATRGVDGTLAILNDQGGDSLSVEKGEQSPTLRSQTHGNLPVVCTNVHAYSLCSAESNSMKSQNPHSGCYRAETARTLDATRPCPSKNQGGIAIVTACPAGRQATTAGGNSVASTIYAAYGTKWNGNAGAFNGDNFVLEAHPAVSGTLCASGAGLSRPGGMGSETDLCVAYCLQGNMIGREEHNGPRGSGIRLDTSFTLTATDRHAACYAQSSFGGFQDGIGTIRASGGDNGGGSENLVVTPPPPKYIVRRLTPTECERLQGFPDDWTTEGHDGKPISDTTRYMMLGNSIAVPCVAYIMQGIVAAHTGV